ncbi:MAG: LPXTG cell wall anchor domain-containing protein [Oscillospiraceae bacterium]|nr:LPXTG cell wall anchor domain-containing protein [Oscillospiraceae bacterium]
MRMKKMLAVLAAISMLASMGVSAAAEDETAAATTVTTAEEAVTTAATEATTTMETTTATEMTSVETTTDSETTTIETTVATEENVAVSRIMDTAEFTLSGIKFQAVRIDPRDLGSNDPLNQSGGCVGLTINRIQEDGSIVETNLSKIELYILGDYGDSEEGQMKVSSVSNFFSIDGDVLTIDAYRGNVSYQYVNGQFVTAGEAVTTTTTTTGTTTTTTVTSGEAVTEEMLYNKYVSECKPVHSGKETVEYQTVNGVLTSAIIVVEDQDEGVIKTFLITKNEVTLINSVPMGGMLYQMETSTFTCSGYDFYVQLVQPASDGDFRSYLTISVYDKNGNVSITNINGLQVGSAVYTDIGNGTFDWVGNTKLKLSDCFSFDKDSITITRNLYQWGSTQDEYTYSGDTTTYVYDAAKNAFVEGDSPVQPTVLEIHQNDSLTVTGTLSYEWDQINENNNFKHAILTLDTPITVKYMDGEWVGKTETIDSVQIDIEDELSEGTRLEVTGNVMYAHTGHHLRNIVLTDCTYKVLGKKNGGTTLNKPSNTTGTPKTGDVATLPAVALGLTMTAAGVAAIIYKKRK